jgi:adenosylcobinamide-phosphate synthase
VTAIALGLGADLLLGDPRRAHPVALFGRAAAALERAAFRPTRRAGAVHAALLTGAVVGLAAAGERALGTAFRAAALWTALGARSLASEAEAVAALVEAGDLVAARRRIRSLVGRDPAALDGSQLCAAAIESVAENTVDAVVAPLLWGAVAGAPGALGHRAVNTLDAMVGHRSPRYARFGTAAARADDALNWPAARLAAGLAAALGGRPRSALRAWRRDAPAHPSPNAGAVEAAFAGALGLRLGGTNTYAGRVEHRAVMGDGRAPQPPDVRGAVRLARRVGLGAALAAGALAAVGIGSSRPG